MLTRTSRKMETHIKNAVDEALGGLGLLTKSDMEKMISKLEDKLLGCIKKEVDKATKSLEARVEALERKIAIYDVMLAS